jgi:hypothetical protein
MRGPLRSLPAFRPPPDFQAESATVDASAPTSPFEAALLEADSMHAPSNDVEVPASQEPAALELSRLDLSRLDEAMRLESIQYEAGQYESVRPASSESVDTELAPMLDDDFEMELAMKRARSTRMLIIGLALGSLVLAFVLGLVFSR